MQLTIKAAVAAASILFVSGCANNEALESQMADLSNRLDNLTSDQQRQDADIQAAQATADAANAEAMRAHKRIDNINTSFEK
ncbi:LPP leucine zipper domain-containing protein [Ferrimonas aestuarii]|uniref:Major outer membrane lipoprotein Lpp n=1 Tax=Ferrimonas aestuarii TaxID=2569539 RepID=A0A4U1BDJ1_9GAMM|nr:LPP leucine zipper domain-containing protein [Ferrimonas aestuarii]TKB49161.1 hypothetical protein FCL42_20880 [Ferrimonas aestuarii]